MRHIVTNSRRDRPFQGPKVVPRERGHWAFYLCVCVCITKLEASDSALYVGTHLQVLEDPEDQRDR